MDISLEVVGAVLVVCILLVLILLVRKFFILRRSKRADSQSVVAQAVREANSYLSTDVGKHMSSAKSGEATKSGAAGNTLDVAIENTLSETSA